MVPAACLVVTPRPLRSPGSPPNAGSRPAPGWRAWGRVDIGAENRIAPNFPAVIPANAGTHRSAHAHPRHGRRSPLARRWLHAGIHCHGRCRAPAGFLSPLPLWERVAPVRFFPVTGEGCGSRPEGRPALMQQPASLRSHSPLLPRLEHSGAGSAGILSQRESRAACWMHQIASPAARVRRKAARGTSIVSWQHPGALRLPGLPWAGDPPCARYSASALTRSNR